MSTSIVNGQVILEEEDMEYEPTDDGAVYFEYLSILNFVFL